MAQAKLKVAGSDITEPDIEKARTITEPFLKGEEKLRKEEFAAREASELGKIDVKKAELAAQGELMKAKAEFGKGAAEREQALYTRAEQDLSSTPLPDFKPSEPDLRNYAQLGSLVMTMGIALGGAKGNALASISALSGALEGWNKGRKDVWEREIKKFQLEFNKIKTARDQIVKNLELGIKKLSAGNKAGLADIEAAKFISGSNSVIAKQIESGRLDAAYQTAAGITKMQTEADRLILDQAGKMAQARQARELAERQMASAERIAATRAAGKKSSLSPQQQSFEDMVSISLNEAAAQVENLATMKFATTGFWQGRNTKGLLDAPLGVLTNNLTTEDVQRYNAVIGIIGREAAKVFAGGRIITDKAAEDFASQFKVRDGDKPFTVLEKMANIRQFFERAIEVKQARPDVNPEMQKIYINALNSFRNSIPITNKEVNEAKRQADQKKGKTKTFGQIMGEMEKSGEPKVSPAATPSESKSMPSGERLKAYADANFEGNETAARQYLQSQGYK